MAARETIYEALVASRSDNAKLKTDLSQAQSTLNSSLLSMQGLAKNLLRLSVSAVLLRSVNLF